MEFKKIYEEVIEKVCLANQNDFDNIVEQEMPKFMNKLVPNEKATSNSLFEMKLDENVATEEDYKDFCEYIFNYIGMDFNEVINGETKFSKFVKPN